MSENLHIIRSTSIDQTKDRVRQWEFSKVMASIWHNSPQNTKRLQPMRGDRLIVGGKIYAALNIPGPILDEDGLPVYTTTNLEDATWENDVDEDGKPVCWVTIWYNVTNDDQKVRKNQLNKGVRYGQPGLLHAMYAQEDQDLYAFHQENGMDPTVDVTIPMEVPASSEETEAIEEAAVEAQDSDGDLPF
jgi:hypothetical protein